MREREMWRCVKSSVEMGGERRNRENVQQRKLNYGWRTKSFKVFEKERGEAREPKGKQCGRKIRNQHRGICKKKRLGLFWFNERKSKYY